MITRDSRDILIADDSLFFRTKLSDILVEAGHRVRCASDGGEVIREIESGSGPIDLLILDMQMPEVDGFGVLKWIRENGYGGRFPVLAITGVFDTSTIMDRLRSEGASGLMSKDFTPERIVFRVNRLLFPDKSEAGVSPRSRVPVSIPVDFTVGDVVQTGFLLNLSESGAYLHTKTELLVGTVVRLRFRVAGLDRIFDIKGIVRWATSDISKKVFFCGCGIMFTSMDEDDMEALKGFIAREAKKLEALGGLDEVAPSGEGGPEGGG